MWQHFESQSSCEQVSDEDAAFLAAFESCSSSEEHEEFEDEEFDSAREMSEASAATR